MAELTHIDEKGNARMVDVSEKNITSRTAVARGFITMSEECYDLVRNGGMTKGDVLGRHVLPALWAPSGRASLFRFAIFCF